MDVNDALDRELIVERAEALRSWLAGLSLSTRILGPIERELAGILANDPGGYINGQRPLAGVTIEQFIAELHSRNAGVIGEVKRVGNTVIAELRVAIPADTEVGQAEVVAVPAPEVVAVPAPVALQPDEAVAQTEEPAAPRRRGRPKGSTKAARQAAALAQTVSAPSVEPPVSTAVTAAEPPSAEVAPEPARRRGRPPRVKSPDEANATQPARRGRLARTTPARANGATPTVPPQPAAPAPSARPSDSALEQLIRLWPSLHPHARRAVVLYASDLLIEVG
ncbi:MAG: hypothetical protein WCP31_09950 [Chloroflexales bacterium]